MIVDGVRCSGFMKGPLCDDDNFNVIFENENDDFAWCTRDPNEHPTWEDIVDFLRGCGKSELVEIQAI